MYIEYKEINKPIESIIIDTKAVLIDGNTRKKLKLIQDNTAIKVTHIDYPDSIFIDKTRLSEFIKALKLFEKQL